jgi:hypothetical protein
MKSYLKTGTRHTANNIITARTRMIEVKANYKNKYGDQKCTFCGKTEETQDHVLSECTAINREKIPKNN